jgi:hypothetical protein
MKGKNHKEASMSLCETGTAGSEDDEVEIIGVRGSKKIKTVTIDDNHTVNNIS